MIKYLGSKKTLVPLIIKAINAVQPDAKTVFDLFSGTARVGYALKSAGYRVLSNDHNTYAETIARCYIQSDAEEHYANAEKLVAELNAVKGSSGYFTETFCVKSRFFQPHNGERIDAIREKIIAKSLNPELESVMLVSLMEAADRVDSTCGLQMAYLKKWASRSFNSLELRVPKLLPCSVYGKGKSFCLDAIEAAKTIKADLVYIDPPYNQHSYLGNYHVWESLIRWDKPLTYGVACKRIDVKDRKSQFNYHSKIYKTMEELISSIQADTIVVSFNNEGFIKKEEMELLLTSYHHGKASVMTLETDFKRYIGAKIGIHNSQGKKVGKVDHRRSLCDQGCLTR